MQAGSVSSADDLGSTNRVTFFDSEESTSQVEGNFSVNSYEIQKYDEEEEYGDEVPMQTANDELMERQRSTANYLQPTLASTLPPFAGSEVNRIRDSYRTGSYWSVKKLPNKLAPGTIQLTRKQHTVENLISTPSTVFKPTSNPNTVFSPNAYIGTDYDKVRNVSKSALEEEKIRVDSLCRKPFVCSSRVRSKTEDIFHDPEYRFPHLGGGTGVFRLESITRSDANNDDKYLKVSMSVKTTIQVQGWLHAFHDQLSRDWPDYLFKVKFTKTDELLVQFERPNSSNTYSSQQRRAHEAAQQGLPPPPAPAQLSVIFPPPNNLLNKYMHRLATHGLAYEYGLKKRGDRWNIMELEYTPPNSSVNGEDSLPSDNVSEPLPTEIEAAEEAAAAAAAAELAREPQWYVPPSIQEEYRESPADTHTTDTPPLMSQKTGKTVNWQRVVEEKDVQAELEGLKKQKMTVGNLIVQLMTNHTLKDMVRGNLTVSASHQGEEQRVHDEEAARRQAEEDSRIHYLTYSFYAPWVTTGSRHITNKYAGVNRRGAHKFGSKLRDKYRLDQGGAPLPPAGGAARRAEGGGGAAAGIAAGGSLDSEDLKVSAPKVKSALKKSRLTQSSFESALDLDPDEMSFGSMSSNSSMISRRSMLASNNNSHNGSLPGSHRGSGLDEEDQAAVLSAVASVTGEDAVGFTPGGGGGSGSGSLARSGMSIRRSLKSFSKSSFCSSTNQLIPFGEE